MINDYWNRVTCHTWCSHAVLLFVSTSHINTGSFLCEGHAGDHARIYFTYVLCWLPSVNAHHHFLPCSTCRFMSMCSIAPHVRPSLLSIMTMIHQRKWSKADLPLCLSVSSILSALSCCPPPLLLFILLDSCICFVLSGVVGCLSSHCSAHSVEVMQRDSAAGNMLRWAHQSDHCLWLCVSCFPLRLMAF